MLEEFDRADATVAGVRVHYRRGGSGPPLVLLHGYPQTHVMWHKLAPALAQDFTVVCPDLRGYGDSGKPPTDDAHAPYSFRAMAGDVVGLMGALGFDRFAIVGHDRGARVAHRLCADHGERASRAAILDIAPTLAMYEATDMAFAIGYYHWFFLVQPADLPERMIGADPDRWVTSKLGHWSKLGDRRRDDVFAPEAVAAYVKAFRDPATVHATCEDYRAAAGIDLEHDRADRAAGRHLAMPLLVLWGARGLVGRTYDMPGIWKAVAAQVSGRAIDCGHFLPEEAPEATLAALRPFLRG